MADAAAFSARRVTLGAGVTTLVRPPREATACTILNGTAGDLTVYSTPDDAAAFVIIAAGYERQIATGGTRFQQRDIAFWLNSVGGGLVILLWV